MKEITFVNADDLQTLEQYGATLLSSMASLRTLAMFHVSAVNRGILNEGEAVTANSMFGEIRHLLGLYKTQLENIMERCDLNEQEIIDGLRNMMPNLKIPRKKRTKKEKDGATETEGLSA